MFSQACVKNSVHGEHTWWRGACMAKGACIPKGACMAKVACMARGGMHGERRGHVWQKGGEYVACM